MKRSLALIIGIILFLPALAGAEYYKYIDKNGNVLFTDNLANVPEGQRYNSEVIKNATKDEKRSPRADSLKKTTVQNFSSYDLDFINRMKEAGIIDDSDIGAVSPEHRLDYIKNLRKMLKELYGIDEKDLGRTDSRYSSPEMTWAQHKEALSRGDFEAAAECFIPSSAKRYSEMYRALGTEEMKRIATNYNPIEKITLEKKYAKFRIRRSERGQDITYYIYFSNILGNWKIDRY